MKNQQLKFSHHKALVVYLSKWLPHITKKAKKQQTQVRILIEFSRFYDPKKNVMRPSQIRIANELGLSTKTIERALADLEKEGVITMTKRHRKPSLISFKFDGLLSFLKMSVNKCTPNNFSNKPKHVNTIASDIADFILYAEEEIKKAREEKIEAAKKGFKQGCDHLRNKFNSFLAAKSQQRQAPDKPVATIARDWLYSAFAKNKAPVTANLLNDVNKAIETAGALIYGDDAKLFQARAIQRMEAAGLVVS